MTREIIDPKRPWKIPTLSFEFPDYVYQLSQREWKSYLLRASQRDSEAEFQVAECYSDGCKDRSGKILVRRSSSKTLQWLLRAAEHGNGSARNNLGVRLGNKGPHQDIPAAIRWLKRAIRQGQTACGLTNLAITYRDSGEFRKAFSWFRKAACNGDGYAMLQLGVHYYWGIGVRRNPVEGVRYFRSATKAKDNSEADRDNAFFYLGVAYLDGKGARRSVTTARKFLERANKDGDHPPAARILKNLQPREPA